MRVYYTTVYESYYGLFAHLSLSMHNITMQAENQSFELRDPVALPVENLCKPPLASGLAEIGTLALALNNVGSQN